MRTAKASALADARPSDLTARARIIDAAVTVFAHQGSAASVRAIAAAAGVSPALITHHFGTKEALKAECDERVLDAYTDVKMAGIADPMGSMASLGDGDPVEAERLTMLSSYMLRAFLDGGTTAKQFYERLADRIADIMQVAADHGMVRPECVEPAHIQYLTSSILGFMLVQFVVDPPETASGFFQKEMGQPELFDAMIDVFTNPVFTDGQILAGYRATINKKEKKEQNV